jgi:predicted permease
MREIGRELRQAARRLKAAPAFTVFSVLTLAFAIGATSGVYAVIRAFMGPPPGVAEPERVAAIHHYPEGSGPIVSLSWPDFQDLRARQTSFDRVMGWRAFPQPVVGGQHSETVWGELVTTGYFEVLGVRVALGRPLQDADDQPGAPPVAVISYTLWQRMFGAAPDVTRQNVRISGVVFDVVGVAPREFQGSFNGGLVPTGFWIPLSAARLVPTTGIGIDVDPNARSRRWLSVRGRLAPGRTLAHAAVEVARIGQQLDLEAPLTEAGTSSRRGAADTRQSWGARPLVGRMLGVPSAIQRGVSTGLVVMLILVLLVACTNLTNLTLARWSRRRGELAIRGALGGTRLRLIRELSLESAALAVAGGALGVLLAHVLTSAIARTPVDMGNGYLLVEPRVDLAVPLAVVLAVTAALFVSGIAPGFRVTKAPARC